MHQIRFVNGEMIGVRTEKQIAQDHKYQALAFGLMEKFGDNWPAHCISILKRNTLSRIIYFNDMYKMILDTPGVICNFGVHWGGSISAFVNLRSLYEPWNTARIVYGFDTFAGFSGVAAQDGERAREGDYASMTNYDDVLDQILAYHESISPLSEYKKYDIIKGDVCSTIDKWLEDNPQVVISLAFFDMDLYKPTKCALQAIKPRLTKGSVLVFDEFNCPSFPGETLAVAETFGLNNLKLIKHPFEKYSSLFVLS